MAIAKLVVSLDRKHLQEVDRLVRRGLVPSRNAFLQEAVSEKIQGIRRDRLAQECAKLDPEMERRFAEEWRAGEASWPE